MGKENRKLAASLVLVLQIGISMMVPIALGTVIGYFLAKFFSIDWLIIIGIFLGVAAGYRNIYDIVKKHFKDPEKPVKRPPTKEELFRKEAEEEFNKWKRERQ